MFSTTLKELNNDWNLIDISEENKKKLFSYIEADKQEIHSLFDCTIRKQVDFPIALNLLEQQQSCYLQIKEKLHGWAKYHYNKIIDDTPYFIGKDFVTEYRNYRRWKNQDIETPVLYLISSDLKAIEDYFVEPLRGYYLTEYPDIIERNRKEAWFIKTDDRNGIHFDSEWYNFYIDNLNGFIKAPHWEEIETFFTSLENTIDTRDSVRHFIETEFTPAIEQLKQNFLPPTIKTEQNIANGKPWQKNYEAVVNIYPEFKGHLSTLLEKGYIIDENKATLTWTTDKNKASKADLGRYFNRIKPDKFPTLWQEVKSLFGIDANVNFKSMIEKTPSSKTFNELCKLLNI